MTNIQTLYPPSLEERPLEGLYLSHDLRSMDTRTSPFVYSNYISSLDGRIAIPDSTGALIVPEAVKNDRDWRLFQELAVQADLLITSGRYLRDYEAGHAQEILQVYENPRFADLRDWREQHGLPPYPALAVISKSGDFPIPEALRRDDRRVFVVTTRSADPAQLKAFEGLAHVCIAGDDSVDAGEMVRDLFGRGYRWLYNATGPRVLHLLLSSGCLDRLYLTQTGQLLGGTPFSTILEGDLLEKPADFKLQHLYYDPSTPKPTGQVFSVYDRV